MLFEHISFKDKIVYKWGTIVTAAFLTYSIKDYHAS